MPESSRDLFLLHPAMAAMPELRLVFGQKPNATGLLIAPADGATLWTLPGVGDIGLQEALARLLAKKPGDNLVALFWPSWSTDLQAVREMLANQSDYGIRDFVVLCGPMDAEQFVPPSNPSCEVLFIGNEDAKGAPVTSERQAEISSDLLLIMMNAGLHAFSSQPLQLFGEDASLRVAGEGEARRNRFAALGIEAWFPRPRVHLAAFRLSLAALLETETREAAKQFDLSLLKKRALTRIEELRRLSMAGLGEADTTWPPEFSHGMDRMRISIVRNHAVDALDERIERIHREVEDYRRVLTKELDQWGGRIRDAARRVLDTCLKDERQWVETNAPIGCLAHLVLHYYPGYATEVIPYLNDAKEPCLPADSPDAVETGDRFHTGPVKFARKHCADLPSMPWLLAHLLGPLLISVGVWWGARESGLDWRWQIAPPVVALCYSGLRYWLWHRLARRIVKELSHQYDASVADLRNVYRTKLRWLREKAALAVVRQFVSRNRTFGRRLESVFAQIFDGWSCPKNAEAHAAPPPDASVLATVKSELVQLSKFMIHAAEGTSWSATFHQEVATCLSSMLERTYLSVWKAASTDSARVRALEALLECQMDRARPILAARIPEGQLDPRIWVRCLPPNHGLPAGRIGSLRQGFAGDRFVNLTGDFAGPAMLCLKRDISPEALVSAIKVSEIR